MQSYKKIFMIILITVLISGILAFSAVGLINDKIDEISGFELEEAANGGVLKNNKIISQNISENTKFLKTKNEGSSKKEKKVIPCGNAIGVKLFTDGILVVGLSEFHSDEGKLEAPAKKSGIKKGDLIKKINGKTVNKLEDFVYECENNNSVKLDVVRNGKKYVFNVECKKAKNDMKNKIGVWVRDSTAGIGTMTFYDCETKTFGALGHGVADTDTKDIIPIKDGTILGATILSVKKGEKGTPGELEGMFLSSRGDIGKIKKNTSIGIYGTIVNDKKIIKNKPASIGTSDEIKEGKAYILTNICAENVEKYEIEIQKKFLQNGASTKGMIIKITDKKLLSKTGGIVQGMSGSPIIQNDKLIGAVTHVFVNDPTRGYGIFIENMLAEAEKIK